MQRFKRGIAQRARLVDDDHRVRDVAQGILDTVLHFLGRTLVRADAARQMEDEGTAAAALRGVQIKAVLAVAGQVQGGVCLPYGAFIHEHHRLGMLLAEIHILLNHVEHIRAGHPPGTFRSGHPKQTADSQPSGIPDLPLRVRRYLPLDYLAVDTGMESVFLGKLPVAPAETLSRLFQGFQHLLSVFPCCFYFHML